MTGYRHSGCLVNKIVYIIALIAFCSWTFMRVYRRKRGIMNKYRNKNRPKEKGKKKKKKGRRKITEWEKGIWRKGREYDERGR